MTDRDVPEVDLSKVVAPPLLRRSYGAFAGALAGAVAVTTGMLVAGIIDVVSPIDAVGSTVIDHVPTWLKDLAIRWFGTNDKLALRTGIVIILAIVAVALGIASARRPRIGLIGIAAFGAIGVLAAVNRPKQSGWAFLPSLLGAIGGAALLVRLVRPLNTAPKATPQRSRAPLGWDRRRFLVTSGAATAVAVVAGTSAQALERRRVDRIRESIPQSLPSVAATPASLPSVAATPASLPSVAATPASTAGGAAGTTVELDSEAPFITPNGDFYRIDTALSFPRIDVKKWSVEIKGMVRAPYSLTYDQLGALPQIERTVTLTCVSNEVGGDLISTATWQGVHLKDVLERAGVDAAAEQVFSTSLDGWTCGFPVAAALDGRDAMIAIGMNGTALPLEHGFPARLVIPGHYGYVSATKWLQTVELNRWSDAQGFWVPLGWSRDGPIKTQSRIDVPKRGAKVAAGPTKIAGVAWAQHRGVAKVEVRVDDGEWREATLAPVDTAATTAGTPTIDTWRPWAIEWQATAGRHRVQVRATDETGQAQTVDVAPPAPNGATGYHTRTISVG